MKPLYNQNQERFRQILDAEHDWPTNYMFKFIVPKHQLAQIEALFPQHTITFLDSRNGNYVSATVIIPVDCADMVIAIYEQASRIEGLIAL